MQVKITITFKIEYPSWKNINSNLPTPIEKIITLEIPLNSAAAFMNAGDLVESIINDAIDELVENTP